MSRWREIWEKKNHSTTSYRPRRRKKIKAKEMIRFETKADSLEELLYLILDEMIYLKDSKQLVFRDFKIEKIGEKPRACFISMKFIGEKVDLRRHEAHSDVKAVTWHQFEIKKIPTGYRASVILDI